MRLRAPRAGGIEAVGFALFKPVAADASLAPPPTAKAGGLEIGFYRDLRSGAAPDGAETGREPGSWRAPSPSGAARPILDLGPDLELPPPDLARFRRARLGGFSALIAANMSFRRHAAHSTR